MILRLKHLLKSKFLYFLLRLVTSDKVFSYFYDFSQQNLRSFLLGTSKGVVHIGASTGQEAQEYEQNNLRVLWVECIPSVYDRLNENIKHYSNQRAILALLGSSQKKEVDFYLQGRGYVTSSLYEMVEESMIVNNSKNIQKTIMTMTTLDAVLSHDELNLYNYLVIDTQGSELQVLEGAVTSLSQFYIVELECSNFELYKNAPLYSEIEAFLAFHGFAPTTNLPKRFHGNVIFVRCHKSPINSAKGITR